jgi:hypothetical protein
LWRYSSKGAFINRSTVDIALYPGTKRSPKSRKKLFVTRLRSLHNQATTRLAESVLHLQAGECIENPIDLTSPERVAAEAAVVEANAHRGNRHLRLFVKRERWLVRPIASANSHERMA